MALTEEQIAALTEKAWEIRRKIIKTIVWAGGGHVGGALSQVDILVILYYHYMNIDPQNPKWENRDRLILSKGHGGVGYAPILAHKGYFHEELLQKFNHTHSDFAMHLDHLKVPGVDASTGSLGHGLPIAVGLALGAKLKGKKWRTFCILGDGECNEGSVWEAAMAAKHYNLSNLTAFVDRNQLCIDGSVENIMALEPFKEKWMSFGWNTLEIDGHDFQQLGKAIENAHETTEKPTMIIANTVKGKGVDYMEGEVPWHYGGLDPEKEEMALKSIDQLYGKT